MIQRRPSEFLAAALLYAERGWHVFPCRGKQPLVEHGCKDATTDADKIRAWWKKWPQANVALATGSTSGVYVIDEDEGGAETIASLALPPTLTVTTGGGGKHFYFLRPEGDRWPNTAKKIGPGVDTRGDGGYVLLPPSITEKPYTWGDESIGISEMPESLIARLRPAPPKPQPVAPQSERVPPSTYGDRALSGECEEVANAVEGNRNHTLNKAAFLLGQLVGAGILDESRVRAELTSAAGSNGLPDDEIKTAITSGLKAGKANPRVVADRPKPTTKIAKPKAEDFEGNEPEAWPMPAEIESIGAPAPTFPIDALPKFLAKFVEDTSDRMQAPPEYVAFPALVALAGAIGKGIRIRPKRYDNWSEPAILWAANIGQPGSLKSPAQKDALAPLRKIESEWRDKDKGEIELWNKQNEENEAKKEEDQEEMPPCPRERRLTVQNVTIEKLADLLATSDRGLTMIFDELSMWLENMSRYSNGSDRQFFLEAWSAGSFCVDRIGRGSQYVDELHLNIVGGIQPEVVRDIFGRGADDGLLDRFGLMAYPDLRHGYRNVDRWPDKNARAAFAETVTALASTTWRDHFRLGDGNEHNDEECFVRFDPKAQRLWDAWYQQHMEVRAAWAQTPEAGLMAKAGALVARLTLVMHLAGVAARDHGKIGEVSEETLTRALRLLNEYLRPTWRRLHHVFGASSGEDAARKIAHRILDRQLTSIRPGDVTRLEWKGLRSRKDVLDAFNVLVDADWLSKPERRVGSHGRASASFTINPLVHGLFGVSGSGNYAPVSGSPGSPRERKPAETHANISKSLVPGISGQISKNVESAEAAPVFENDPGKPSSRHLEKIQSVEAGLESRVDPGDPGTGAQIAEDDVEDLWGPK